MAVMAGPGAKEAALAAPVLAALPEAVDLCGALSLPEAAAVLARFGNLEAIPTDTGEWHVDVRSAATLNAALRTQWQEAQLFRRLATLRTDAPLLQRSPDELFWRGARRAEFGALCEELGQPRLVERPHLWQDA